MAAHGERVPVTCDVADFPPILREWAEARPSHAGVILIHGIRHNEFGLIIEAIGKLPADHPDPSARRDRAAVAGRGSTL